MLKKTASSHFAFPQGLCAQSTRSVYRQLSASCALKGTILVFLRSCLKFKTASKPLIRRILFILLVSGIFVFYGWLSFKASVATLPTQDHPVQFYSNQTRQDIQLTFSQAIKKAHQSLFISVYGISDQKILSILCQRAADHLPITVEYDPSASAKLKKILPSAICVRPIKSKGLMHRKIVVIDKAQVFLGSANLTATSLRHHANLVLGLYHPELAAYLETPTTPSFCFKIDRMDGEIFLLPDPQKLGIQKLIESIENAQKRIHIAMFTMTHPEIAEALIQAKKRGVQLPLQWTTTPQREPVKRRLHRWKKRELSFY